MISGCHLPQLKGSDKLGNGRLEPSISSPSRITSQFFSRPGESDLGFGLEIFGESEFCRIIDVIRLLRKHRGSDRDLLAGAPVSQGQNTKSCVNYGNVKTSQMQWCSLDNCMGRESFTFYPSKQVGTRGKNNSTFAKNALSLCLSTHNEIHREAFQGRFAGPTRLLVVPRARRYPLSSQKNNGRRFLCNLGTSANPTKNRTGSCFESVQPQWRGHLSSQDSSKLRGMMLDSQKMEPPNQHKNCQNPQLFGLLVLPFSNLVWNKPLLKHHMSIFHGAENRATLGWQVLACVDDYESQKQWKRFWDLEITWQIVVMIMLLAESLGIFCLEVERILS